VSDLDLGFGGQRVPLPAHISLFHSGDADLGELVEFLRGAIGRPREAVVLLGPPGVPAAFLRKLESDIGRKLDAEVTSGRLVLMEGERDPDAQLSRLVHTITTLTTKGAAAVRVVAFVAWEVPGWPAAEDFLWIESRLGNACAHLPVVIICAYDVTSLPGPALIYGGIESHPLVSIGGKLASNPLVVAPEAYPAERLFRLPWLSREASAIAGGAHGMHACAFFMNRDEEYATLLPLIQEGVARGQGAFHIIDPQRRADHLERLNRGGLDVQGLEASQKLEVRNWHETYLMEDRFDPERTLGLLGEVIAARPGGVHLVADMSWALGRAPGVDALVEYEARFNQVRTRYNDTVICTYDSARFAAATMLDILRAHPVVILGGVPQDNGLYTPPAALISELHGRTAATL
jgi:hypothetical protein